MREAAVAEDFADAKLMHGMRVAMHEAYRGGGDALGDRIERRSTHGGFIERREHFTLDADTLGNLAGEFVEDGSRLVMQREEIGAALIADVEEIAEALRDEQRDAAAFALE